MKISGGFWLIQHLFDPEANGTGGHFPFKLIADPLAKHCRANWSNDGNPVVFNARLARKDQCEDHFLACVQVAKTGLGIHGDDIGRRVNGRDDVRQFEFAFQVAQNGAVAGPLR